MMGIDPYAELHITDEHVRDRKPLMPLELVEVVLPKVEDGLQIGAPRLYWAGQELDLPWLGSAATTITVSDEGIPSVTITLPCTVRVAE